MTCCIGLEHNGETWIGFDSASTTDDGVSDLAVEQKGWIVNGWALAYAGSFRCGELLRLELRPKERPRDAERYLKTELVQSMRSILHAEPTKQIERTALLVGSRGMLFSVDCETWAVARSRFGYTAIGAHEGLTAIAALEGSRLSPRARLLRALKAVARHATEVAPPFSVIRA